MKRQWKFWFGVAISVVALVWTLWRIDLREAVATLAQAEYVYLIPATVGILAYLFLRSIRWRLLLPGESVSRCFWVTNIGYLVSNVLPFRLGDPARAVVIGQGGKVATSFALSTVVVERVLDTLMVVALLAGVSPFVGEAGSAVDKGLIAGGAAVVASAGLLVLAFRPEWGRWAARLALGWVPGLEEERWMRPLDGLLEGLAPLRSGRRGLALLAWSVVTWFFVVAYYWALMRAFLPETSMLMASFVVCGAALGMAIPASPGSVGVYHGATLWVLTTFFGVPEGQAGTLAFALHTFQYVVGCLMGLIGLAQQNLSLRRLQTDVATALTEEGA